MRAATFKIIETTVAIVLFIFMLVYAVSYEIELFRYRSMAGIVFADGQKVGPGKKSDSPEKQAVNISSWENLPSDKLRLFSYQLAYAGAWGYLAFTALCCLALEQSIRKVGEQFDRFCGSFEDQQQPAVENADSENAPYDGTPDDSGANEVRNPSHQPDPARRTILQEDPEERGQSDGYAFDEPGPAQRAPGGEGSTENQPGPGGTARPHTQQTSEPELQEVIGGSGERVSRTQALQDKHRYYVNPTNGEIWDRKTWESLHGPSQPPDDGEPEAPRARGAAN